MKALGVGAALGTIGWVSTGGVDLDEHDGTVHTVEAQISFPPSHPDRPVDFFFQPTGLHVDPGDVVKWRFVTPDHTVVSMHPVFGMRRRIPVGADAFSSPLLGWDPDSIPDDQIEPPMPPAEEPAGGANETGTEIETETDVTNETTTATNETATDGEVGEPTGAGPVPDTWLYSFETPGVYDIICSPHEGFGMAMRVVVGDETETEFETSDPEALPEPRAGPVGLARVTLTDSALDPENIVEAERVEWFDLEANEEPEGEDGGGEGEGGEGGEGGDGNDGDGVYGT